MTVTFRLNLSDWKAFLRAINGLPTHLLWFIPLLLLGQQVFFAVTDRNLRQNFAFHGWVALTLRFWIFVASLVACVVMYHLIILNTGMRFQNSSFSVGPTTIVADKEGISATTTKKHESFSWTAIHRIIDTDAHFFVLSAPSCAFIVPKRAFESPTQLDEFSAFLKAKWAQHHPDVAPIAPPK